MNYAIATLISVIIIGNFSLLKAEGLNDRQMDAVCAGVFDADIGEGLVSDDSSLAAQKNIGVIGALSGELNNQDIRNANRATVRNEGNSAAALQTNIGVEVGLGEGLSKNSDIRNTNFAFINNRPLLTENEVGIDADLQGLAASGQGNPEAISSVSAGSSAVAAQTNLGIVAVAGALRNSDIDNRNQAIINNRNDSAVAIQSNVGVIASFGQDMENLNDNIDNDNIASINNRVNQPTGFVEGSEDVSSSSGSGGSSAFSSVSALRSSVSAQTNLGAISASGTLRNSDVNNSNRSTLRNDGDSALALQANIAAIAGSGEGLSRNNDIRNSNFARVDNEITDTSGAAEGLLEDSVDALSGINSLFSSVDAMQSAAASQDNIAVITSRGDIANSSIRNRNDARVTNEGL